MSDQTYAAEDGLESGFQLSELDDESLERAAPFEDENPGFIRAVLVGALAAVLGGGAWAILAIVGQVEVGWIAWGIGLVVGLAMAHTTSLRNPGMGGVAAGLAAAGLIVGKLLIVEVGAPPALSEEIQSNPNMMTQAGMYQLQASGTLPEDLQQQYDAVPVGDSISDALWNGMIGAAESFVETLDAEQRAEVADHFAGVVIGQVGVVERVSSQLSGFDLIWFALALSTAWRIMSGRHEEELVPA